MDLRVPRPPLIGLNMLDIELERQHAAIESLNWQQTVDKSKKHAGSRSSNQGGVHH